MGRAPRLADGTRPPDLAPWRAMRWHPAVPILANRLLALLVLALLAGCGSDDDGGGAAEGTNGGDGLTGGECIEHLDATSRIGMEIAG